MSCRRIKLSFPPPPSQGLIGSWLLCFNKSGRLRASVPGTMQRDKLHSLTAEKCVYSRDRTVTFLLFGMALVVRVVTSLVVKAKTTRVQQEFGL